MWLDYLSEQKAANLHLYWVCGRNSLVGIDLIPDTRHPCSRFRTDGIRTMSRACFRSGANKWQNLPIQKYWGRVGLFGTKENHELCTLKPIMASYGWSLFLFLDAVATVYVPTTSKTWVMELYEQLLPISQIRVYVAYKSGTSDQINTICRMCGKVFYQKASRLGGMFIAGAD